MVLRCLITYYSASCLVSLSCSLAVASSPFLSSTCNRVAVGNLVLGLLSAGGARGGAQPQEEEGEMEKEEPSRTQGRRRRQLPCPGRTDSDSRPNSLSVGEFVHTCE